MNRNIAGARSPAIVSSSFARFVLFVVHFFFHTEPSSMRLFAALLTLVILQPLRAAEPDVAKIDALAVKSLKDFEAPGLAVCIVKDDKVILAKGYGVRQIGMKQPVTADTLFAIASCTKAFTAASVAALVDDKLMKWDDPIRKHLPWFAMADPLADREVTLRDALCHRTGLSRHDVLWFNSPYSRDELLKRVAHIPATTSFRSTWEYNNIMFVAAGAAAGQANHTSWEELAQKRLFDKLGMKTACFRVIDALQREHASPHRRADDRVIDSFRWDALDHVGPAGSINANVNEMALWLRMQLNAGKLGDTRILSTAAVKEMQTAQMVVRNEGYFSIFFPLDVTAHLSYGLGWFVADYRGQRIVSHGGTLEGFRAQCVLVPEKKLGVFVVTNLGGCRLPEAMTKNLVDMLCELPERDWNAHYTKIDRELFELVLINAENKRKERKPDTKPTLPLADYAGEYTAADYGEASVILADDNLSMKWNGFPLKLSHFHYDTFSYPSPYRGWEDTRVTFQFDGAGKVKGLTLLGKDFKKR